MAIVQYLISNNRTISSNCLPETPFAVVEMLVWKYTSMSDHSSHLLPVRALHVRCVGRCGRFRLHRRRGRWHQEAADVALTLRVRAARRGAALRLDGALLHGA